MELDKHVSSTRGSVFNENVPETAQFGEEVSLLVEGFICIIPHFYPNSSLRSDLCNLYSET